ncbi:hypothetical protein [Lactiplantibacillus daowaiensis]|uniref:Uncharacterized protein n=1 Tax=Lactiplantibacillus daowaiensis TaxID=2559918 RepID=A0ABW1S3A2_9LACO|nr:hypothetical protein [Lactiplantibacillus daowaiensis]
MIGHVTKLNLNANEGILTDFHGHHFKFALAAAPTKAALRLGQEFYFKPALTAAGLVAMDLCQHHHDGTRVVVPTTSQDPKFVRIGDIVINLAQVQYYEMTTTQNEIRNGYESRARHLMIQMKGGRQFNFYNWDSVNIDEVMGTLDKLHIANQKLG